MSLIQKGSGVNPTNLTVGNTLTAETIIATGSISGKNSFLHRETSATQSLTNNINAPTVFNTTVTNSQPNSEVSITSTSRYTCDVGGLYTISYQILFATNATGFRQVWVQLNGVTTDLYGFNKDSAATTGQTVMVGTIMLNLSATDYIEVISGQSSGGALNIGGSATSKNRLQIYRNGNGY